MRFKNIHDFFEIGRVCPLCNNETELSFNIRDQGFVDKEFRKPEGFARSLSKKDVFSAVEYARKSGVYISNIEDDYITYWYKGNPDKLIDIMRDSSFGINMYDNSIDGDTSMICKLIWEYNISLYVRCVNEWCFGSGFLFAYSSKPLTVERKSKKISPLILEGQIIGIPNKDVDTNNSFSLMTLSHHDETFMLDRCKVLSTMPKIDLFSIKNLKELERKIKTLMLFV